MTRSVFILGSHSQSLRNFRGALIAWFRREGWRVDVAAPGLTGDAATTAWLDDLGASGHEVALARTGLNPVQDLAFLAQVYGVLRRLRPTHFIGYTIKPVIWGITAAWAARVPHRVAMITGLGYAFTGQAKGLRAVIQVVARALYGFALRRATLVLFQNDDDVQDFSLLGILPPHVPVTVVNGSGVDTQHFAPLPLPDGPIVFLLIARLLGDKGIREYVQAARQLRRAWPQAQFHLVGGLDSNPNAIARDEVQAWHDEGAVIWKGEMHDVRPAIAAAHVYVLPSYREGTPRTVLEAMACGRPIITTDAPGCRQTVEQGVNGLRVPVADVDALQKAMAWFLSNPDQIAPMGAKARHMAVQKYDVRKVNASILAAMGIDAAL